MNKIPSKQLYQLQNPIEIIGLSSDNTRNERRKSPQNGLPVLTSGSTCQNTFTKEKPNPDWYGEIEDDCPNCGGEGFIYVCHEEWACVDPEGGCDLCMQRCDWCNSNPLPPHGAVS